jgi:hypothetical protein
MAVEIPDSLELFMEIDKTIADLDSSNEDLVLSALWSIKVGDPLPSERLLQSILLRMSDPRLKVRELAIWKSAQWTSEPLIAKTLLEILQRGSSIRDLETVCRSVGTLLREKHFGYEAVGKELAEIVRSPKYSNSLRQTALNTLLFGHDLIDPREYASPKKGRIDLLLSKHSAFLDELSTREKNTPL